MIPLNTNTNALLSAINTLQNDIHAFTSLGVAKGVRNQKQRKNALIKNVSDAIASANTTAHGIRVIFITTKE